MKTNFNDTKETLLKAKDSGTLHITILERLNHFEKLLIN